MVPILDQVIGFVSGPDGNLIYSLVLGLIAFSALISCWYAGGRQQSTLGKRMLLGLLLLFAAQLMLSWNRLSCLDRFRRSFLPATA